MANTVRNWTHTSSAHAITEITGSSSGIGAWCGICRGPVFRATNDSPWRHLINEPYLAGRGAAGRVHGLCEFIAIDSRGEVVNTRVRQTDMDLETLTARAREFSGAAVVLVAQIGAETGYDCTGVGSPAPSGRRWLARIEV